MKRCGDCVCYHICSQWVTEDETFPEIEGGCKAFKSKADFVEVVRCRDCKRWTPFKADTYCRGFCGNENGLFGFTKPDDFCSYRERKEGAE